MLDAVALVAAALGLGLMGVALVIFIGSAGNGYDFVAYDAAARRILAGEPLYLADTVARYASGAYEGLYLYPPPMALALLPLAALPTSTATAAWLVLRLGALIAGVAILPVSRTTRLLTLAVACVSYPVLFDLNLGNVSVVVFALLAVAWRSMDGPFGAVAHAALVAIRFPFAVYFVEWLVERRFQRIAWTLGIGILLIALSLLIVGLGTYLDYVTILRGLPDISTGPHNLSLKTTALAVGVPEGIAGASTIAGYLAGIVAIVAAARRGDRDVAFVVTAVASLLVSPFIHPHYLVLLLLPAALLVERGWVWALALPLLGWLPDAVLPLTSLVAIGSLFVAPRSSDEPRVETHGDTVAAAVS